MFEVDKDELEKRKEEIEKIREVKEKNLFDRYEISKEILKKGQSRDDDDDER